MEKSINLLTVVFRPKRVFVSCHSADNFHAVIVTIAFECFDSSDIHEAWSEKTPRSMDTCVMHVFAWWLSCRTNALHPGN
jgi:hypothetical protein